MKITLEQSVSGTTPVIYNDALTKFYDDFKEKFIENIFLHSKFIF